MKTCIDEDFAHWAFGKETWDKFTVHELDCMDLMLEWNKLHGDLYLVEPTDYIEKSLVKMKELYEQKKD